MNWNYCWRKWIKWNNSTFKLAARRPAERDLIIAGQS